MVKEGQNEHETFPHIHVLFPHIYIIRPHKNNANKKTQKNSGFNFSRLEGFYGLNGRLSRRIDQLCQQLT